MHDMSSCLLEGYDVIPSAPVLLRFSNLHTNFVILHWDPPARHGETVTHYELVTLQVSPTPGKVITYPDVQPPHILENLGPKSTYEVHVKAVNDFGVGSPSSRLVFRTRSKHTEFLADIFEDEKAGQKKHNMT